MNDCRSRLSGLLGSFCLGCLALLTPAVADEPATTVLFIGHQPDHPWGSHMYLHTSQVLARCVELSDNVETRVSDGWPREAAVLDGVDTIVVYTSPAAELLLGGPHREAFMEKMRGGCGLVTIHWASTVRKENLERLGQPWIDVLGGTWISNVGLSTDTSILKQLNSDHPICRGWEPYELRDEFYLNPRIGPQAEPLLEVTTKNQTVIVGWAHERAGGGRSYATTLGHFYENFQHEPFRRAIVNAILWTAHREVPESGAPVELSEAALRLPDQTP